MTSDRIRKSPKFRVAVVVLGASLITCLAQPSVAGAAVDQGSAQFGDLSYISANNLVDIGGRKLNLHCTGHGSPAIIFEAGLGDQSRTWAFVQPAVGMHTLACSYVRAGLGFSDPSGRPGTSENAVNDLHRLLISAGIPPPYILVGHSLGGMYVRLYAYRYRTEVVGLVLVDPVSEEQGPRLFALDPTTKPQSNAFVESIRTECIPGSRDAFAHDPIVRGRCVNTVDPRFTDAFNAAFTANHSRTEYFEAAYSEWLNVFTVSSDQVRAAKTDLGDMPLAILTRSAEPRREGETQTMRIAKNSLWNEMHDELAALSSRGTNQVVAGTSHYVHWDRPEVVIETIRGIIEESDQCAKSH